LGTATLIGPRLLLTAGHVVFDPRYGGDAVRFEVTIGGNVRQTLTATNWQTTDLWKNQDSKFNDSKRAFSQGDIGVIVLPNAIDLALGVSPLYVETAPKEYLVNSTLNVAGYSAKVPNSEVIYKADTTPFAGGISANYVRRIFYPVATYEGMSGGPVWEFLPNQNRVLRAVHTSLATGYNYGCAITLTGAVFSLIQKWQLDYHPNT
jgi:V8-like Glu-specific endopeptidase